MEQAQTTTQETQLLGRYETRRERKEDSDVFLFEGSSVNDITSRIIRESSSGRKKIIRLDPSVTHEGDTYSYHTFYHILDCTLTKYFYGSWPSYGLQLTITNPDETKRETAVKFLDELLQ